jgi:hypothetical protein
VVRRKVAAIECSTLPIREKVRTKPLERRKQDFGQRRELNEDGGKGNQLLKSFRKEAEPGELGFADEREGQEEVSFMSYLLD